jgi:hypothetical protein
METGMDSFDVRELRCFVAVAEELNFSRAAERLGMAQPPLSRAIRQMERRLGANLFDRDTRQVALTDVGRTMLDEARFALDVIAGVNRRARRAALTTPTLVTTAKPGIATGMLRRIVDTYTPRNGCAPPAPPAPGGWAQGPEDSPAASIRPAPPVCPTHPGTAPPTRTAESGEPAVCTSPTPALTSPTVAPTPS